MNILSPKMRFLLLPVMICAIGSTVAAQPAGVVGRPIACVELPEDGPDPRSLGLGPALALAEQYRLDVDDLAYTIAWAEREGNPVHVPILKEIVEAYRCGVGNAALALLAIGASGEPRDYFLGYVADARRDDALASYAIGALEARRDRNAFSSLRSVVQSLPGEGRTRGPRGFDVRAAFWNYEAGLRDDSLYQATQSTLDYINNAARSVASDAGSGELVDGQLILREADPWRYAAGRSGMDRQLLRELARIYPTAVREAVQRWAVRSAAFAAAHGESAEKVSLILPAAIELGTATAFPTTAPPVPPVRPGAALSVAVCRSTLPEYPPRADTPAAVFTYTTAEASPFSIPYGSANQLRDGTGASLDGSQPEVFVPGAEALDRTVRVLLPPGASVSWVLAGQTVTVDGETPLCGSLLPVAPTCHGQPATIYVSPAGLVVGGPLAGTLYAGRLVGTSGPDVIVGTDNADALLGLGGDDTLCGGAGDDALDGGPGADTADG